MSWRKRHPINDYGTYVVRFGDKEVLRITGTEAELRGDNYRQCLIVWRDKRIVAIFPHGDWTAFWEDG